MVFLAAKLSSIDAVIKDSNKDNPLLEQHRNLSLPQQQDDISPALSPTSSQSSIKKSSTSAIINPFQNQSNVTTPEKSQPMSLAFLHKKKRSSSDPLIDIPSPQSLVSSPLASEARLIRKKSGELVKSSLRLNQLNNAGSSKSMPNTPIFKNVQFGQDVDVRYFNETEKPSAVSAQNSPTLKGITRKKFYSDRGNGAVFQFDRYDHDNGGDDDDDDYDDDDDDDDSHYETWDMEIMNFDKIRYNEKFASKALIFLETISLNTAKDSIVGIIAVKNKSYQKNVHLRYTFDNWKTVIEIECNFENDNKNLPRILKRNNYDRFKFQLELKNFKFLIDKEKSIHRITNINLKFCIRYSFDNLEIWDNNANKNYEITLIHKPTLRRDKFSLNDSNDLEKFQDQLSPKSDVDDYFSYKMHNYDFSKPVPAFSNSTMNKANSSSDESHYEFSLSSPDTPKVLKNCDDTFKKLIEPDEEISLDPILKDLNSFTGSSRIQNREQINQFSKYSDGLNKLSLFDDSNDKNIPLLSNNNNNNNGHLVFGRKPSTTSTSPTNTSKQQNQSANSENSYITLPTSTEFSKLPSMNSKSYQELIDSYCFFKGNDADNNLIQTDLNPNIDFVNTMFKPSFRNDENSIGSSNNGNKNNTKQNIDNNSNAKRPSTVSSYLDHTDGKD